MFPIFNVTIDVAPPLFVPLLKTEYCELVTMLVQFVALKFTVTRLGQFQKAYSPMVSRLVPSVNEGIAVQP